MDSSLKESEDLAEGECRIELNFKITSCRSFYPSSTSKVSSDKTNFSEIL